MYEIRFSKQALKDKEKLKQAGLGKKAKAILDLMLENPFKSPPSYEKLSGELKGFYSRRINAQHRMVYQILEDEKIIKILRMWTHYE